jgi:hypothetical protein
MPSYTQVVLTEETLYLQNKTYSAQDDRRFLGDMLTQGAVGFTDCAVTWTSGLTLSVATGKAYISGGNIADQGKYRVRLSANKSIAVGAGHATLPRLDQIIIRVMDASSDTSGLYETRIEAVPGTATSGATLANRLGAANLNALLENSRSVFLLADVLVPAGAAAINQTNIADKRTFTSVGLPNTSYTVSDATTNNIVAPLTLSHATSVTAAAGFGTALDFTAENAGGSQINQGRIGTYWIGATAGSENSGLIFQITLNGTPYVTVATLDNAGDFNVTGNYRIDGALISAANLSDGVLGTGQIVLSTYLNNYAVLASPALTGNPTAPTQAAADNSTRIATTAYVKSQGYATTASATFTGITTVTNLAWTGGTPMGIQKAPGSNAVEAFGATWHAGSGLRIPTKAGAPADGDYSVYGGLEGPGLIALDFTNNRLYVRTSSGVWRYAALT